MPAISVGLNGARVSGVGGFLFLAAATTDWTAGGNVGGTALDVARWEIDRQQAWKDLVCSGQLGATTSRCVGYRNAIRFQVILDPRWPPDAVLRPLAGKGAIFNVGGGGTDGDPSQYAQWGGTIQPLYYWAPCIVLDKATPILDANGKKMVRMQVEAHSNSHLFLCPIEGKFDNSGTPAGAYAEAYAQHKVIQ